MKKYLIITQGSQAIQLIRELYSLNINPHQIFVITVTDKFNLSFLEFLNYYNINYKITNLAEFNNDLSKKVDNKDLVISFSNPFIIKKEHLSKTTFINFHPGLLPKYRGSLSTVYSLINNEINVGGTWHYMIDKVDCGNIITKFSIKIEDSDTAFSLNHKIFKNSINLLGKVLKKLNKNYKGYQQNIEKGKFYFNIFPDISNLNIELQKKINYFPPKFI
jgi:methionyl-tRNA formyltransferase